MTSSCQSTERSTTCLFSQDFNSFIPACLRGRAGKTLCRANRPIISEVCMMSGCIYTPQEISSFCQLKSDFFWSEPPTQCRNVLKPDLTSRVFLRPQYPIVWRIQAFSAVKSLNVPFSAILTRRLSSCQRRNVASIALTKLSNVSERSTKRNDTDRRTSNALSVVQDPMTSVNSMRLTSRLPHMTARHSH
ncbi:hypothetical protein FML04_16500 [Klebsiella oxytoca]|uniref:Uncharacterized protein n=1 Tax=Klebsiella michiganensis TaxID=1134687 RepID=A0A2J5QBY5_9ENTR|nr:hypothetical protein [Klebsiella oxytoca]MBZ7645835.1 hypothetical protein [Klebsiella oxytoca]MBZ7667933.1 hypothetical protein [Klebsiella oxytoca]PLO75490.1 hypothetical protein CWN49_01010 [Klebsiella michiganensis]